ncbi:leucyl/phenylalanyl-tRNA--protein transferase [Mesonia sp. MT50]|uniref:Leucyl/phenylalanyl-tRNA--protein transferase n=1 Tax=Mesonia profundi TaxID=3070998 RepID=A0ABU0ZXM3_9FLAO|nr:leucyl/phenylalanyl-tRNA--protein transferase [Mesonia profundi]MDQ7916219.1 leucyl/phenylalanyl-tRNA--protein transferase [Mesonia profundi]
MIILRDQEPFPPIHKTDEGGLLAMGGSLTQQRLWEAYNSGIFPWYEEEGPVLWWSPDPRMVLFPQDLKVSKSMKQLFKKQAFKVTYNQNFEDVMRNCAQMYREGQDGTWITNEMVLAYIKLHQSGHAVSVEVWQENNLVGGLYGVYLKEKQVFCGESMFAKVSNASKYGFISLVRELAKEQVKLIDCQVYTAHLESLGAKEIDREVFLSYLKT